LIKIGQGYDVHRLVEGRRLIIGGVEIPFNMGLAGHSDADVLLHAISDALLGAASFGDIGHMFPDTDPDYKNADSVKLLEAVVERLMKNKFKIVNIDSTIIAQEPKLKPYIVNMREIIAAACHLETDCVSVKATTEEGLGFSGRGEGIAASAVCLLEKQ
jgi:2-C-methyl-D-erythritol 2,4-cyclodiphosphate synthase